MGLVVNASIAEGCKCDDRYGRSEECDRSPLCRASLEDHVERWEDRCCCTVRMVMTIEFNYTRL
jgi:hypothetical protein